MDKTTQILENFIKCKYFEVGVPIKNPIKNSYQDGLGRTTQTLDHVVMVHISIWDKRKSQINDYSDSNSNFGLELSHALFFWGKFQRSHPTLDAKNVLNPTDL